MSKSIDAFEELRDAFRESLGHDAPVFEPKVISVDDLMAYSGQVSNDPWQVSTWDGGKFYGGFGETDIWDVDYWTLRKRSVALFTANLYARGIVRRLITNEINTGLSPEARPDEDILMLPEDSLTDWTETVENRFEIWAKDPLLCDFKQVSTFGELQREARLEALISGDVLVVLRSSQRTGLPTVQLIPGDRVRTPYGSKVNISTRNEINQGVEQDKHGRIVAYWVAQEDGSFKRLPAWGEKSGRKLAWLVFATEKRHEDVRGQPLLSLVLQSLKEIDRYRDSTQRKQVVNSLIAGFIKKTQDKPSSLPLTGAAVRKDTATISDSDGSSRNLAINKILPGTYFQDLQQGEEPVPLSIRGNEGETFSNFEEAIIAAVAWANQIPPEILRLSFSNNYSASQAAINEFKIYINLVWSSWGESFCSPIYIDWLLSETLIGKNPERGVLDSWRDPKAYDIFGAWTAVDWYGSIKPSTDMLKQAKGSKMLVDEGWSTNARESRVTTGTKFSKNIKRLKRENELKAEAMRPIAEFKKEYAINDTSVTIDAE